VVHFHSEYVPNEQIAVYFSACDAVVLPYLEATQSGVAQLAIGFEKPMIATSVGGMPETIHNGETGLIVPPGDSAALADAVVRFFAMDWLSRSPGISARCASATPGCRWCI